METKQPDHAVSEVQEPIRALISEGHDDRAGLCTEFDECWHCRVLAALTAANEKIERLKDDRQRLIDTYLPLVNDLREREQRVREYVWHRATCDANFDGQPCSCGLAALLGEESRS